MKFLLFVCGFAAVLVGMAVGCGPQQAYCPNNTTGLCISDDGGAPPPPPPEDASDTGAIIIGQD
jgi:hypothetical protein